GEQASTEVTITVGTPPEVEITTPPEGGMVDWGDDLPYQVQVTDDDDVDCDAVEVDFTVAGSTTDETTGCEGAVSTGDPGQTAARGTLTASYGSPGEDPEPVYETIFDGTQESLDKWEMAGPGSFVLTEDGAMRSQGGLGMLWYPEKQYRDFSLKFQFRDARTDEGYSNGGVLVRFPDPRTPVDERPECGRTGSAATSPA